MAAYLQWRRFVFFDRETVREPSGPDGAGAKPFALPPGIAVCDSGRGSLVFGDILCGAGRCGLRGARPSWSCVAGEFWALSSAGRRVLWPWECGSFPLSVVLCLKKKKIQPNRRWDVLVFRGCSAEVFAVALPSVSKKRAESCMIGGVGLFFFFPLCALTVIQIWKVRFGFCLAPFNSAVSKLTS